MAWEKRRGKGSYYTRTKRRDGRFVREYYGVGPVAELAAVQDARRRVERGIDQELLRMAEAQEVLSQPLDALSEVIDVLVKATLTGHGYHQHDRGEWRLKLNASQRTEGRQEDPSGGVEGHSGGG